MEADSRWKRRQWERRGFFINRLHRLRYKDLQEQQQEERSVLAPQKPRTAAAPRLPCANLDWWPKWHCCAAPKAHTGYSGCTRSEPAGCLWGQVSGTAACMERQCLSSLPVLWDPLCSLGPSVLLRTPEPIARGVHLPPASPHPGLLEPRACIGAHSPLSPPCSSALPAQRCSQLCFGSMQCQPRP